jgi:hypothetical protein
MCKTLGFISSTMRGKMSTTKHQVPISAWRGRIAKPVKVKKHVCGWQFFK